MEDEDMMYQPGYEGLFVTLPTSISSYELLIMSR